MTGGSPTGQPGGDAAPSPPPQNPLGRLRTAFSASAEPRWLNPATAKGALLVLAGLVVIASPDSDRPFRIALGVAVLAWVLADVWVALLHPSGVAQRVRLVALAALGVAILTLDDVQIGEVLGAGLLALAALSALRAMRTQRGGRAGHLVRAALLLAAGVSLIVVPQTAILAVRAGLGASAALVGAILLRLGLDPSTADEHLDLDVASAPKLANLWLQGRKLDPEVSDQLAETIYFEPPRRAAKLAAFWVMMGLATAIATFAIVQDSTAVVIGAMLVAPLMTPIMGVSAAAVNGWPARIASSLALVAAAVAAAIALAWIIAAWLPSVGNLLTNTQVTSRTEPNLIDLCIALAAGAAGAYATVNPRVSSSLSGVAIAVALVPPLAVVGLTLEAGQYSESIGAFLLFLTNFVSIVLVSSLVFVLTGFAAAPPSEEQRSRLGRVIGTFLTLAALITVPLSLTTQEIWSESSRRATVEEQVGEWLTDDGLMLVDVEAEGTGVSVTLTGDAEPEPDVDDLERRVEAATDTDIDLSVRVIPSQVLRPEG